MSKTVINVFILCILISTLASCGYMRTKKFYRRGELATAVVMDSIPFNMKDNIPIVRVTIDGIPANMLFDTGAPNVISSKLKAQLELKRKTKLHINDSGGNSAESELVLLPDVQIGHSTFKKTAAVVLDLQAKAFNCRGVDGVIGANLMKTAKWHIDYKKNMLYFSTQENPFPFVQDYTQIPFETAQTFTPKINVKVGSIEYKKVSFDTGSNSGFKLQRNAEVEALKTSQGIDARSFVGTGSTGAHGAAQQDTNYIIPTPKISMGYLQVEDYEVWFGTHSNLLGNKFLKHFDVVMDWDKKTIYLHQLDDLSRKATMVFGAAFYAEGEKLLVALTELGRPANELLNIKDEVVNVNGTPVGELDLCDLKNLIKSWQKKNAINLEVVRGDQHYFFNLDASVEY